MINGILAAKQRNRGAALRGLMRIPKRKRTSWQNRQIKLLMRYLRVDEVGQ